MDMVSSERERAGARKDTDSGIATSLRSVATNNLRQRSPEL